MPMGNARRWMLQVEQEHRDKQAREHEAKLKALVSPKKKEHLAKFPMEEAPVPPWLRVWSIDEEATVVRTGGVWSVAGTTGDAPPSFADMERRTKEVATAAEKKRIAAWCKKLAKKQEDEMLDHMEKETADLNYRRGIADGIKLVAHLLVNEGKEKEGGG